MGQQTGKAMLVYQAGIANVFAVGNIQTEKEGRIAFRVYQGDFYGAAMLARGMMLAGVEVATVHCNMAGDIALWDWDADLENAPFRDSNHFYIVGRTLGESVHTYRFGLYPSPFLQEIIGE